MTIIKTLTLNNLNINYYYKRNLTIVTKLLLNNPFDDCFIFIYNRNKINT